MPKQPQRRLDHRTMTYAFADGSGLVTNEQVQDRALLRAKIEEMECEPKGDMKWLTKLAGMKFKFLTFFSK